MIIRELKISSFGKFNQKEIKLTEGINLLYGQNEAGKSTIQKFIEGVLYGFYNRELKVRRYTEDYDRYAPWSNPENYQGAIVLEKDGRLYRIERVFTKNSDSVRVLDEVTGEDISEKFTYNNTLRVTDPAEDILSVSRTTFVNTLSISQLSCETDEKLGGEVVDKIMGMLDTADTDLSLKKVTDILDKKSGEIGTQRQRSSPLGSLCVRIGDLKQELELARQAQRDFFALMGRIEELTKRQEEQKKRENELSHAIERQKLINLKETYEKAVKIRQELTGFEERLKELEAFSLIDTDLAHATLQKGAVLNNLKEARENLDKQKSLHLSRLENLQKEYEETGLKTEDEHILDKLPLMMSKNEAKDELEGEIKELKEQLDSTDREISSLGKTDIDEIERDIDALRQLKAKGQAAKSKTAPLLIGTGAVLTAVSAALGVVLSPMLFAAALAGAALAVLGLLLGKGKGQAQTSGLFREILSKYGLTVQQGESALVNILNEQKINQFKLEKLTEQKKTVLAQLKEKQQKLEAISSEVENYKTALTGSGSIDFSKLGEIVEKAKSLKDQIKSVKLTLEQIERSISENSEKNNKLWDEVRSVLAEFNCANSRELKNAIAKKQEHDKVTEAQKINIQRLKDLLGPFTLEELEKRAAQAPKTDEPSIDIEKAQTELERVRKNILETSNSLAGLSAELKKHEERYRTVGEVETELAECQEKKERLEKEIAAIELAVKKLNEVSANLHREFAPDLNKKVSAFVAEATGNKYDKIYIDKEMNVSVEHEGRNIKVSALSNGTIDLIYIAMRIGLIDFLQGGEGRLPLIFDDSFTQIDDGRLSRLLSALGKVQNRQILIFTCHNREREILKTLGIRCNYIPL